MKWPFVLRKTFEKLRSEYDDLLGDYNRQYDSYWKSKSLTPNWEGKSIRLEKEIKNLKKKLSQYEPVEEFGIEHGR